MRGQLAALSAVSSAPTSATAGDGGGDLQRHFQRRSGHQLARAASDPQLRRLAFHRGHLQHAAGDAGASVRAFGEHIAVRNQMPGTNCVPMALVELAGAWRGRWA